MNLQECIKGLRKRDYGSLDSHFNQLQREFENAALSEFQLFDALCIHEIQRVELLPNFFEWADQFSDSYAANTATVSSLVGVAWEARHLATSDMTAKHRFELMSDYLTKAIPYLEKAISLSNKPFSVLIEGMRIQASGTVKLKRDYLSEARKLAHQNAHLCRHILWVLNPKWSGDEDLFHDFYSQAVSWSWDQSQRNYLEAAYHAELSDLALCWKNDPEQALQLGRKAIEIDPSPSSYAAMARRLSYCDQPREAESYLLKALADYPTADRYYNLGCLRHYDLDDHEGAKEAYEKAIELGHGESAANWVELHLTFSRRPRMHDPELFDHIDFVLQEGMRQYSSTAWYYKACCYINGEGVKINSNRAVACWMEAAKLGCELSCKILGSAFWNGSDGLQPDYDRAFFFMDRAVKYNNLDACASLGRMYYLGHGTDQDYETARHYLEIGAEQNAPEALADLASIYWLGHGVMEDKQVAKSYLKRLKRINIRQYRKTRSELMSWTSIVMRKISSLNNSSSGINSQK